MTFARIFNAKIFPFRQVVIPHLGDDWSNHATMPTIAAYSMSGWLAGVRLPIAKPWPRGAGLSDGTLDSRLSPVTASGRDYHFTDVPGSRRPQ